VRYYAESDQFSASIDS